MYLTITLYKRSMSKIRQMMAVCLILGQDDTTTAQLWVNNFSNWDRHPLGCPVFGRIGHPELSDIGARGNLFIHASSHWHRTNNRCAIMLCKAKRQYLLTCKLSRYCLLTSQGNVVSPAKWVRIFRESIQLVVSSAHTVECPVKWKVKSRSIERVQSV